MTQGITEQHEITQGIDDAFQLFHLILHDPSILDRLPRNARIFVVSNRPEERNAERAEAARKQAINSFDVGDLMIYITHVPTDEHGDD